MSTVREEREWTYNYEKLDGDAGGNYGGAPASDLMMGQFLGGTETFDGVTTEWGPNWTQLGQKADLTDGSLVEVTSEDVDALPFEGTAAFSRTELMHRDDTSSSEEITYSRQ